jgi:ubiquinone/menaquinone biosynthesis C-methylase UbiE
MSEKWFPKVYDTLMGPLERRGFGTIRERLVSQAEGKVLEIGSGTGFNFPYYQRAQEVIALEPDPVMREKSLIRANSASVPIKIIAGKAEKLPFQDNEFDTVVGTLVLCTVEDPIQALEEVRRVCKRDGKVLFFEHVRINDSWLGMLQDWLTPGWKRLCDGCHLNRNTLESIGRAGFEVVHLEQFGKKLFVVAECINRK